MRRSCGNTNANLQWNAVPALGSQLLYLITVVKSINTPLLPSLRGRPPLDANLLVADTSTEVSYRAWAYLLGPTTSVGRKTRECGCGVSLARFLGRQGPTTKVP